MKNIRYILTLTLYSWSLLIYGQTGAQVKGTLYCRFSDYIFDIVYEISTTYKEKEFNLRDYKEHISSVQRYVESPYYSILEHQIDEIYCTENAIGSIDVFHKDSLIVDNCFPIGCGEFIFDNGKFINQDWNSLFAYDQSNRQLEIDSLSRITFYQQIYKINKEIAQIGEWVVDRSTFSNWMIRHSANYCIDDDSIKLMCGCGTPTICGIDSIKSVCKEFCNVQKATRINFELFSWHRKSETSFIEFIKRNFPKLHIPIIINKGNVASQKTTYLISNLLQDASEKYFNLSGKLYPLGWFYNNNNVVTIIKDNSSNDIMIYTFTKQGERISSLDIHKEDSRNCYIREDGHIFLLNKKDDYGTIYTISRNGVICLYQE